MKEFKVRINFMEELLGTTASDLDASHDYICAKSGDNSKISEEVEAIKATLDSEDEETKELRPTIFPKDESGVPYLWDYQIKGFFKDTCGMLRKVSGTRSSKIKAFKKEIDGLVFVKERKIPILFDGEMGICTRPLRASTMQGERVALACSETCPAGSVIEFTIQCFTDDYVETVKEWLDYGAFRGMGQWRNSGKGKFTWEEVK